MDKADIKVKDKGKLKSVDILSKHKEYLFPSVVNYYKEPCGLLEILI